MYKCPNQNSNRQAQYISSPGDRPITIMQYIFIGHVPIELCTKPLVRLFFKQEITYNVNVFFGLWDTIHDDFLLHGWFIDPYISMIHYSSPKILFYRNRFDTFAVMFLGAFTDNTLMMNHSCFFDDVVFKPPTKTYNNTVHDVYDE